MRFVAYTHTHTHIYVYICVFIPYIDMHFSRRIHAYMHEMKCIHTNCLSMYMCFILRANYMHTGHKSNHPHKSQPLCVYHGIQMYEHTLYMHHASRNNTRVIRAHAVVSFTYSVFRKAFVNTQCMQQTRMNCLIACAMNKAHHSTLDDTRQRITRSFWHDDGEHSFCLKKNLRQVNCEVFHAPGYCMMMHVRLCRCKSYIIM